MEALVPDEAEYLRCQPFTLVNGVYKSVLLKDFKNDVPAIGRTFDSLLALPNMGSICVEYYPNMQDVICMVRMKQSNMTVQ